MFHAAPLEDQVWENVLTILAENGRLSRFYKVPRHEMAAYMKIGGAAAPAHLLMIFSLVQNGENTQARDYVNNLMPKDVYPMLLTLLRSVRCWVETEGFENMPINQKANGRWKIAHA